MTRREHLARIVASHDERLRRWELERLLATLGLDALSDDALEQYARALAQSYCREQEMNRRNRENYARQMENLQ